MATTYQQGSERSLEFEREQERVSLEAVLILLYEVLSFVFLQRPLFLEELCKDKIILSQLGAAFLILSPQQPPLITRGLLPPCRRAHGYPLRASGLVAW